ncbi:MAG: hemoglobin-like protein [endosymbiont of Galathealinum brachiosum]|uniref:Hemoglobin-like protein n=1 Tax=endosymbiont of Galathealinum brachiosum TaxID=2200906 RepID=A0A370DD14_9GAMM|nr:MAG: hemoglobin-like protein [endosymbiont of Galathealinum brachiosum]
MKNTHYESLGGEKSVRELVDRFYDLMDKKSDMTELRELHAPDLTEARKKLFMFLSGWLGGPSLYIEKYGHPRLRQRHISFVIGEIERDQWMSCIQQAMTDMNIESELKQILYDAFYKTADFMRNR